MSQNLRERKGRHDANEKSVPYKKTSRGTAEAETSQTLPTWTKIAIGVATCLGLYWWLIWSRNSLAVIASVETKSDKIFFSVNCSKDFDDDPFEDCRPKKCGRVVMDSIVTEEEAVHLLGVAKRAMAYGGSHGGASILDLHSGAFSMGDKFINIYRVLPEEDSFTEKDFAIYRSVKDRIQAAIANHFGIPINNLYLTRPTFFSRMNTTEAKTVHDEYWHPHIDKEQYESFHYTSLLYLSTYKKDFTGGRFIFVDTDRNKTVEPRLGRVSFFTSGSENVHYVEKVKAGVRHAITIAFSCDPTKAIKDPSIE